MVMQAIGLTENQRMRMMEIRRSHDDDVIAAGRRIRLTRQALDRAIMSEPYNEAAVNRAIEEFAAAQADKIKLEARIRAQLRGVLTSEQMMRIPEIERQLRRQIRQQQMQQDNQDKDLDKEMGVHLLDVPGPRAAAEPEEIDLIGILLSVD